MNKDNYVVIMAGGVGERFWPLSRESRPKQFLDILGTGKTLLQQTFERFLPVCDKENIFIVTNKKYKELVLDQLPELSEDRLICEPARKNTAPCIAYAVYKIYNLNPRANIVMAPSDHIILKEDIFHDIIRSALDAAPRNNRLFTLGITPGRPDTGYGYIQFQDDSSYPDNDRLKKVKTFTEKPNRELAESFLESGDFLWNSGIFIWSAEAIMSAFEEHQPEISYIFREALGKYNTPEEQAYMDMAYPACKSISIDYAIMEKADNVYVFVSDLGWSDLGTWSALFDARPKDAQNNAVTGKNAMLYESKNCIVSIPEEKLVVIHGLDDYIISEADNALLICKKTDEQQIRKIVNDIRLKIGNACI